MFPNIEAEDLDGDVFEGAEKLAADNAVRFEGNHWKPGPHGVPILEGVTSWMLGRIIEEVSGQAYPDYIRDHITRPAGTSE